MPENLIFWVILTIVVIYIIYIYNNLIALRAKHKNFFSQIDIQLKRRYDLIPNLVETAKKYMSHEEETLTKVIQARNNAQDSLSKAKKDMNSNNLQELAQNENSFVSALGGLNFVMEDYPELKADGIIKNLQEELSSTENKISFARQAYNDSVMRYNIFRQSFPNNIISNVFGHSIDANLLEFDDASKIQESVKVTF
jgi:LemA protein